MTVKWRRRTYILLAVVVATFVVGALTSTAFAKLRGKSTDAESFNVTYVGVTDPWGPLPDGELQVVLRQESGRFNGTRRSEMTVNLEKIPTVPLGPIRLLADSPCNEAEDILGWCLDLGRQNWAAMPLQLSRAQVGDTFTWWGPAFVQQVSENGAGPQGLSTYRATLEMPADPAVEGVVVTLNLDGFIQGAGVRR